MGEVEIRGETIRLGQLLKYAGVVEGGGGAKAFLAEHEVLVNGARERARGRQLHPGDRVHVGDQELLLVGRG